MKMNVNFGFQAVIGLAVVALVVYLIWKAKKAGAAVLDFAKTTVTETINPASDKNIVYGGVNAVVQAIPGNESATLGTAIYDSTHDSCGGLKWPWQSSECSPAGPYGGINPGGMYTPDLVKGVVKP